MKINYLLLLIVVCSFTTYGQEYHRLLNESTYWDIAGAEMGYICSGFSDNSPSRYSFSGDTIIQGKTYAKAYYRDLRPIGYTAPPNCPPFYVDTVKTLLTSYFLREDTTERKVWMYSAYNGEEELLFDFSLQQGDTLYHELIVASTIIDTVYNIITSDGVVRKKFIITPSLGESYYIEGIGGVAGLFHRPYQYFESGTWLMCVKDSNDNSIFDVNGSCYDFITNVPVTNFKNKVDIYPNPVSKLVTIETILENSALKIYNQMGQEIFTKEFSRQITIDLSEYTAGIYLINILKNNEIVHSEKIIKKNGL
ncbi:MAG: T9SS type A sorting domain-containing protein [Candidatus Shapirobacteria bacterium]